MVSLENPRGQQAHGDLGRFRVRYELAPKERRLSQLVPRLLQPPEERFACAPET